MLCIIIRALATGAIVHHLELIALNNEHVYWWWITVWQLPESHHSPTTVCQPNLQCDWSCFICSIIVLLLLVSKSFQTVLQRLLLYDMIATTLNELFNAASIVLQFEYRGLGNISTSSHHHWDHGVPLFTSLASGQGQNHSTIPPVKAS